MRTTWAAAPQEYRGHSLLPHAISELVEAWQRRADVVTTGTRVEYLCGWRGAWLDNRASGGPSRPTARSIGAGVCSAGVRQISHGYEESVTWLDPKVRVLCTFSATLGGVGLVSHPTRSVPTIVLRYQVFSYSYLVKLSSLGSVLKAYAYMMQGKH